MLALYYFDFAATLACALLAICLYHDHKRARCVCSGCTTHKRLAAISHRR